MLYRAWWAATKVVGSPKTQRAVRMRPKQPRLVGSVFPCNRIPPPYLDHVNLKSDEAISVDHCGKSMPQQFNSESTVLTLQ